MKNFILLFSLLGLFTACSPDTHVNSVTGEIKDKVKPTPPTPDVKTCQHPDAANYTEVCTDEKGSCIFYACKDPKYQEYEKYLTFKRYIEKHGGEIYHDPSLCKTIKGPEKCQHPDAINLGANDFCDFKACPDKNFTEYEKYLDYQDYINQKGGGDLIGDNSLCKTGKVIPGCMDKAATNYNSKATLENGSCNFDKCSIEGREKFDPDFKVIFDAYLAKLAAAGVTYSGTANTDAICGIVEVLGCMDPKASNYDSKANVDDKSCEFKACTKEGTPGYVPDQPIRDAQAAYKAKYPSAKDLISDITRCNEGTTTGATTGGAKEGCTDPKADNYDPTATVDNKSCIFKACNTAGTENYIPHKPIRDAQAAYKTKYPTAADLIAIACGGVLGCTDQRASNYNSNATVDDKSCVFKACNTAGTENYIPHKPIRDAQAAYKAKYPTAADLVAIACGGVLGCTDPKASNYNPNATADDKSCEFKACQTAGTENYDLHKAIRDAYAAYKAKYPDAKALMTAPCGGVIGCMDPAATNYDPSATVESKKCNFSGCIDSSKQGYSQTLAEKFRLYLEKIGGQGQYQGVFTSTCGGGIVTGCMNQKATNYNPLATKEDCSCVFAYCPTKVSAAEEDVVKAHDLYVKLSCPNAAGNIKNTCNDDGGESCEEFKDDEMAKKNKEVRGMLYPNDCSKAYFDSIVDFDDQQVEEIVKSCERFNNCKNLGIIDLEKYVTELKLLGLFDPTATTYLQVTCVKLKIEAGSPNGANGRTPEESQKLFDKYCECINCGEGDDDGGGMCKEDPETADDNKNSGYTFSCDMLKEYSDNFNPGPEFDAKVKLCYETKDCFEKGKVDYSAWEEDLQILKDRAVAIGFVTPSGASAFQYFYNIPLTSLTAGWKSLCVPVASSASGFPYNDSVVAAMYKKYCTCADCGPTTPPPGGNSCDKLPASDSYLTGYNGYFYNCEFLKAIEDKYCITSPVNPGSNCNTVKTARKYCESRKYCAQRGLLSDASALAALATLQSQLIPPRKVFFYNIHGFEKYLNGQAIWYGGPHEPYDYFDSFCMDTIGKIESCKMYVPTQLNNCDPETVLTGETFKLYKSYCAPCEHECAKGKF